jgi:integrase
VTIKLSTAIEEYLAMMERKRRSPETIRSDQRTLKRLLIDLGDIQIASITPKHIEKWFYGKQGIMSEHKTDQHGRKTNPAVAPATHNQYRSRLKVFFDWCRKQGHLKKDLLEHVDPLKVQPRKRQRPAPHTLLEFLEAAANPRDRCWIALALNTALRSNEIKRIKVGDVDLESGFISVNITKTQETDEQPISSDLDEELRRWLTIYTTDIGRPLRNEDFLFPNRIGNLISHYETGPDGKRTMVRTPLEWTPDRMIGRTEIIVQVVLEKLGLPTKYEGTHTIRRAIALAYFDEASAEQGDVAALRETAALLHHAHLSTTERYLGMTAEKNRRNKRIKGRPFLTAMVAKTDNVVPLRKAENGQ